MAQALRSELALATLTPPLSFDVRLGLVRAAASSPDRQASSGAVTLVSLGTTATWPHDPAAHLPNPSGQREASIFLAAQPGWHPRALATRDQLFPDHAWADHPLRATRAACALDEFFVHAVQLPARSGALVLQLDRALGAPWNQHRLVALSGSILPAIARVFFDRVLTPVNQRQAMLRRLTPAQRELIPQLLQGKTETAIAKETGRSHHTIHDHVKSIYAILCVTSRLELYSKWHGHAAPALPTPANATFR